MAILISGCSTGIGLETALFLKDNGFNVIASARSEHALHDLREQGLSAVQLDVNNSNSIKEAVSQAAIIANGKLDVLINNAGYGQPGALEDLSRDVIREQFETNVFGLIELSNTVLPYMRENNKGLIINISSILGLISLPFRGAYCASKYAVEGYSDSLRLELANTNINVSLIEPGPIVSHFRRTSFDKAIEALDTEGSPFENTYKKLLQRNRLEKAVPFSKNGLAVAKKVLKAINAKHPKPRYKVTIPAHFLSALKRLLSSSQLDWVLKRVSADELEN